MTEHIFITVREELSLSQRQLGEALGIESKAAQSRVSNYENGIREIPRDIAYTFIDYAAKNGITVTLEQVFPRNKENAA
ncbi:MAG: helix-turn-helix transcriptional regulator [Pseudomonadota bacterium]